jgi:hypothetical protein
MSGLTDEARREVKEIDTRTGRANPFTHGWSHVVQQITSDGARLDQIIGPAARSAAALLQQSEAHNPATVAVATTPPTKAPPSMSRPPAAKLGSHSPAKSSTSL